MDQDFFRKNFNTKLTPQQEGDYQLWIAEQSGKRGRDMSREDGDYDMRGFFKAGSGLESGTGHFPDTYKKPNHPTFSNESMYHGTPAPGGGKFVGGQWKNIDGKDYYAPSPEMLNTTHDPKELMQYMQKAEPDVQLVLPPVDLNTGRRAAPVGTAVPSYQPQAGGPMSTSFSAPSGTAGMRNEGTLPTR